ncbi:MAG: GtrA family protein [Bacilli bacterium]
MDKQASKKESKSLEILRFLIIGLVATGFDFLTKLLVSSWMKGLNEWLILGVSTLAGFVIGVIVNYVFSVLWVFQNVADQGAAKKQSKFWLFVFLGFIGLLISEVIFYGFHYLFISVSDINIVEGSNSPKGITKGDWNFLSNKNFWVYFAIFCVSTLIVLVWNYKSRKKWIFIAPKTEEALAKSAQK